jgi:hypothetical protein
MSKPVWLLNRFAGCWRWLRGRVDSPWYSGMRMFTQLERDSWSDVVLCVRIELDSFKEKNVSRGGICI